MGCLVGGIGISKPRFKIFLLGLGCRNFQIKSKTKLIIIIIIIHFNIIFIYLLVINTCHLREFVGLINP
jgi:hypothetical protein